MTSNTSMDTLTVKAATSDFLVFWYCFFLFMFLLTTVFGKAPPSIFRSSILWCLGFPLFIAGFVPFLVLCTIGESEAAFSQMPFAFGKLSWAFDGYYDTYLQQQKVAYFAASWVFLSKFCFLEVMPHLFIVFPIGILITNVQNIVHFYLFARAHPEKFACLLQRIGTKHGKIPRHAWSIILLQGYETLLAPCCYDQSIDSLCAACVTEDFATQSHSFCTKETDGITEKYKHELRKIELVVKGKMLFTKSNGKLVTVTFKDRVECVSPMADFCYNENKAKLDYHSSDATESGFSNYQRTADDEKLCAAEIAKVNYGSFVPCCKDT